MVNKTKVSGILLLGYLFLSQSVTVWSQQATEPFPVFTCDEMAHDFGKIRETARYATHEFIVKNTGTAPLIITHVLTSCGCARPEWSKTPIDPGKEGFVIVTYDMMNRPGPFTKNITAFTNERTLRQVFTIMGDVIPKPETLNVLFHDTIGTVQLERTSFMFYTMRPQEIASTDIWIRNFGKEDIEVVIEDVPEYINVIVPTRLESDYPERLKVELDGTKIDRQFRGRLLSQFAWKEVDSSGTTFTQSIPISANFIDDLSAMTPAERADGPAITLSTSLLDYGKLKTGGFLGLGNKRVYRELVVTNAGKSALHLHSITADNPKAQIAGFNRRVLQPEETLTLRVFVNPKDVEDFLITDLFVISNDPRGPVREVQILAER
jgi:hypothetical protein